MASEMTSSAYISHHLTNWTFGAHPEHGLGFAHTAQEAAEMAAETVHKAYEIRSEKKDPETNPVYEIIRGD